MKVDLNSEFNKEQAYGLFYEYKELLIPSVALIASLLILLFFLLPDVMSISQKKSSSDSENQKLTDLKTSMALIQNTDTTQLSSNLSLATSALPQNKDFESIIDTLSTVAADTNVQIDNYAYEQGTNDSGGTTKANPLSSFPEVTFTVGITANPSETMSFIDDLYKKVPLSEVTEIDGTSTNATLKVAFFYKPFTPVGSNQQISIQVINPQQKNTLNTISGWDLSKSQAHLTPASSSAEIGSPF